LLGIDPGFFSPPSYVQSILDCVASTSLESILLYGFNLSNTELIGFLDLHRDTLEEINLIAGCISTGSSASLLAWIRDNMLGLKELELFQVCFDDHTICADDARKDFLVGRGKDMQAGLADILDKMCKEGVEDEAIDEDEDFDECDDLDDDDEEIDDTDVF
jgi:hypothetical protein